MLITAQIASLKCRFPLLDWSIKMKKTMQMLALIVLGIFSLSANAQISRFVEGTHYTKLENPVRTADETKIEVIELFWYGCPGCYTFEPLMSHWESSQPTDVDHKRLPAVWDPLTTLHARAFYAAEAIGAMDAIHHPFFDEFHLKRNRLHNEVAIRDFFESCGISREDFERTFNSFSVRTKVTQAANKVRDYGVAQTPTMYVNGKYVVTTSAGGYQQMLDVVDYLVSLERG